MKRLNVGLIGSGFMGRSHALAWRMAPAVFGLPVAPRLEMVGDVDEKRAAAAARTFGAERWTADWQELIADRNVDLVDITTPNMLHKPMALAAIAAGKPVYCEKPLAPSSADARAMAEAAERAKVPTFVGFNYVRNPMARMARQMVEAGEIGEVWAFRGIHAEDYMSDPAEPWTWRLDPEGGAGAVADLGSHIIAMARHVVGRSPGSWDRCGP
jgi:predicted dehydrogenase